MAVCDFPTIRDAAAVVPDLTRAGVQIGAVELLDDVMMKAVQMSDPSLGYEEKPTLFFKFVGSKAQIDHEIKVVSELVKKHSGGKFKYATTQAEKDKLWEGRKVSYCFLDKDHCILMLIYNRLAYGQLPCSKTMHLYGQLTWWFLCHDYQN